MSARAMNGLEFISAFILAGGLILTAAPAAAQQAQLEKAWTVCAKVSEAPDLRAALATEAPAAGFPHSKDGMYAGPDGSGKMLVISVEEDDYEAQCTVSNVGDRAQMVERAARFWQARGYRAYESSRLAYAARWPGDSGIWVDLKQAPNGAWQMTVSER